MAPRRASIFGEALSSVKSEDRLVRWDDADDIYPKSEREEMSKHVPSMVRAQANRWVASESLFRPINLACSLNLDT